MRQRLEMARYTRARESEATGIAALTIVMASLVSGVLLFSSLSCSRPAREAETPDTSGASPGEKKSVIQPGYLVSHPIGNSIEGRPWIANLTTVDLDQDGLIDVVFCDGRLNTVYWIRQETPGNFVEKILDRNIAAPANVEATDLDDDGDLDLLVASMGIMLPPNNERIGAVIVLENDGSGGFGKRTLIDRVNRVTDVQAGDLDDDGDLDLVVGQFGFYQGEIRWMENRGHWEFVSHPLLDLSGTIHTPIVDIDADRDLDIVALVSQEWEEIYAFDNRGGTFQRRVLYGSTNEDYGSSGMTIADVDGDGDPDIVYTNGSGFDYGEPGPRPWHGVQWLENNGRGFFRYHRLGDFPGAYSPLAADIDGDGDHDILAVSRLNDWGREDAFSIICFEQVKPKSFLPRILALEPTLLLALDAADMDGDGEIELVTGGFHNLPPWDKMSRILLWDRPN